MGNIFEAHAHAHLDRRYKSISPQQELDAIVVATVEYGAFVTLDDGREGLVHISNLRSGHVGRVEDVCKVWQRASTRLSSLFVLLPDNAR